MLDFEDLPCHCECGSMHCGLTIDEHFYESLVDDDLFRVKILTREYLVINVLCDKWNSREYKVVKLFPGKAAIITKN